MKASGSANSDMCSSFTPQVLEHDWIDEKVKSDITIESSWKNLLYAKS